MRYLVLLSVCAFLLGCGEAEPAKKQAKVKKKSAPAAAENKPKEPPPAIKVDAKAFASVPEALDVYLAGVDKDDQESMAQANNWMVSQGAAAVAPLSAILADEKSSVQQRIVACKILAQLPGTKSALLGVVDVENKQLRLNVIQGLGKVKPADKQVVDKLMALAKDKDAAVQREAVKSLGKQGPAAKDAVPLVQSMLNDTSYNDTVRAEARNTLKSIDPRKGLMGISGEKGK